MGTAHFKKGLPLPNGWEGSVVGGRVTGGDAPVWEIISKDSDFEWTLIDVDLLYIGTL